MGLIHLSCMMKKLRPQIKYYQFYIYMPPKKKMKQKQKQKQSQNVRQSVTVNIQQKTQRRPVRRSGTRTAPLVHYQQAPIPLAPAIDYGKLEHQIASINNTILHNLKNNQRTNNIATAPPINQPAENVNLMSGLAAAERQRETEQTKTDGEFAGFQQQRADEDPVKRLANILKNQSRSDVPTAEVTGAVKGRPRKDTQIAQPLNRTVEGSVSGGGFPKTPVVKAVGKKLTPKDSPVAGRTRSATQTDVAGFFSHNKTNSPRRLMKK